MTTPKNIFFFLFPICIPRIRINAFRDKNSFYRIFITIRTVVVVISYRTVLLYCRKLNGHYQSKMEKYLKIFI